MEYKRDSYRSSFVRGTEAVDVQQVARPVVYARKHNVTARERKAFARQKACFVVVGILCAAFFLFLCCMSLKTMEQSSSVTEKILATENELSRVYTENEAHEFELRNSVDLNYIIDVATNTLGMQRIQPSQIVIFSDEEEEFIRQVAPIPKDDQ